MDSVSVLVAASLFMLTGMLTILCVLGFRKYAEHRVTTQLMWAVGLAFAAVAMAIEAVVFVGAVSTVMLQAYVFASAAIVGVLSLGAVHVLRNPRIERVYAWYILAMCGVVGIFSFLTPVSLSMVSNGVITGDPPLSLIVLSSLVTFPATVVLLWASAVSLRRNHKWQSLLMIAGALILGAGGTLYIASFPVALYYAEFLGIVCLFVGLLSLSAASTPAATPVRSAAG